MTETPEQHVKVDTGLPTLITLSSIGLGEKLPYDLSDSGSGLSRFEIVIEDKEGNLPPSVWAGD